MIKCENCIMLREDLKEAYDAIISIMDIECCDYNMGDIYDKASAYIEEYERRELLQEDLKEAYLYILAVKEYNQNDYGRGDLITKARQYLHLEV